MDVPHVLQRGEFGYKADDMPLDGAKHDALRMDPDVELAYVADGDRVAYDALDGAPDAVAERLSPVDPRVAVLGADRVLHLAHDMAGKNGTSPVYASVREKQVWTGPAATYSVVVDETRQVAAGLVEHATTLVHVPEPTALGPDAAATRYRQVHGIDPGDATANELHHAMTTLDVAARVPPASMDLVTYQQDIDETVWQEVRDGLETGVAAGLLREDALGFDGVRFG